MLERINVDGTEIFREFSWNKYEDRSKGAIISYTFYTYKEITTEMPLIRFNNYIKSFIEKLNDNLGFNIDENINIYENDNIYIGAEKTGGYENDYSVELILKAKRPATDDEMAVVIQKEDMNKILEKEKRKLLNEFEIKEIRIKKGEKFEDVFGKKGNTT